MAWGNQPRRAKERKPPPLHVLQGASLKRVVITDRPLPHVEEERIIVEEAGGLLEVHDCRTKEELRAAVHDADVILANLAPMDRKIISGLTKARGIVRYGVGYDAVDVEAATEKGIYVANVPGFCTLDVAEHTIGLLLCLARKIPEFDSFVRTGRYTDTSGYKLHRPIPRLAGKKAGIVGFGGIGREVARRLLAFGLSIVFYDPYLSNDDLGDLAGKVEAASLGSLLEQSDIVTLHVPLTTDTRGMIGREELEAMKTSALLVNASRGGVVDEEELARAVQSGTIAGGAVDTLSPEPPPADHPLLGLPRILVTPHIAWYSEESVMDLERMAANQAAQIIRGEVPTNLINTELL
jgi:D-3-phosphoglycerate dehydrogenase